jgi:hypothetical protein
MQKYAEEEQKKLSLTSESTSHKSCFVIFFALGFDAKAACNACNRVRHTRIIRSQQAS